MTGSFSRLLERHPDGMEEWFHWDEPSHTFAISIRQSIDNVLTMVREQSADTGGWSKSGEFKKAAIVPEVALREIANRYGPEIIKGDNRLLRRVLDGADYANLRVKRLSR